MDLILNNLGQIIFIGILNTILLAWILIRNTWSEYKLRLLIQDEINEINKTGISILNFDSWKNNKKDASYTQGERDSQKSHNG